MLSKNPARLDLQMLVLDDNYQEIVLVDESKVTGYGSISFYLSALKGKTGVIKDIILDYDYRGRGYEKMLIVSLIQIAIDQGANIITLTSNSNRTTARHIYKSLDFVEKDTGLFVKIPK